MSVRKQIDALQKQRNGHLDAMTALSDLATKDARLFSADEQTAFDKDQAAVRDIDKQLERLTEYERQLAGRALPANGGDNDAEHAEIVPYKPFKAQGFVRMVLAVARAKGNIGQAADFARRWHNQTPEV